MQWQKSQTVTVNRNPKFWGQAPGPASVIWVLYQNEDVMAQALGSGEVDVLTEVPPTIWDGLKGTANVTPVSLPGFSFHHIGFNVSNDPKSEVGWQPAAAGSNGAPGDQSVAGP